MTQKLKNNKATGNDFVPNEILKCNNLLDVLYNLLNYCFVNHTIPYEWSKSRITPILKPNKCKFNPLNYRGISLLSW